jgi:hypothetical protein
MVQIAVEYVSASSPLNQNVQLKPNANAPTKAAPYTVKASDKVANGSLRKFRITITEIRYKIITVMDEEITLIILPRQPRSPKGISV